MTRSHGKPNKQKEKMKEMIVEKLGIRSDREHGQGQVKGKARAKRI
jgi:hypothetical protein